MERGNGSIVVWCSFSHEYMILVVYAAGDASAVTKLLDNLKTLISAVISAVGIISLVNNVTIMEALFTLVVRWGL